MRQGTWRGLVAACSVTAMLAMPAESNACEFLNRLFGCGTYAAAYPTYYAAPACTTCAPACSSCAPACSPCAPTTTYFAPSSCCPTTTCSPCETSCAAPCSSCTTYYAPQTYYRPVVQAVATTTYRPVIVRNAYTGFPMATYRPVVSYRPQITLTGHTSYSVVQGPAVSYAAPIATASAAGCASCASAPAPVMTSPSSTYTPTPAASSPATTIVPSTTGDPADVTPRMEPQSRPSSSTFGPSGSELPEKPIGAPLLRAPTEQTTLRPIVPYRAQVTFTALATERAPRDTDGWRAAN